jgi:predicted RNA-binding protein with RPS1 domain
VHISTVPRSQQDAFMQKHKEGDALQVEVLDYDKASGRIRLKIVE